ncbi:TetR/AcrR family transcriptional regulator C-terminal domain-containing protein [Cellulomonas sp. NTE-D12]|uniref:TetR/AcrR family transcriptional regulator C-terminal domain-containing protein n=1 Tax=Cellulomonas sp. NTE-D12 TaxID=2962632 RepID=UPI00308157FC|nr:GntR family transcriptional regulator [Cellulomonas sp. NTE-D12]
MPEPPTYVRVADSIAAEIRSGRIAEGARVPSTRQIVREWGVAMATATKVLQALRSEGLVDSVRGSGTVVRRGARGTTHLTPATPAEPTLQQIVETAVGIADADGLPLVTMRRVAAQLGVATVTLGRHVRGREALTLHMVDSVFADVALPELPVTAWRPRLETVAHVFWTAFARHPWAAEVFSLSRPHPIPSVMPIAEWSLSTLRAMGLPAAEALAAHVMLFGYVRGMALARSAEQQAVSDTGVGADDWVRAHGDVRTWRTQADAPGLRYVSQEDVEFDLDGVYAYGLSRLLDGLEARRRASRS